MSSQHYISLDKPREIRLLRLEPAAHRSTIRCSLTTASLNDTPSYEALSYVWGDATHKETINLSGRPFEVTKNLGLALRYLRHERNPRTLWIDAVCINQDDVSERNHQVALMRDVYEGATKVLVWFGVGEERDERAVEAVERVNQQPTLHWTTVKPQSKTQSIKTKFGSKVGGLFGMQSAPLDKVNLWDVFVFLQSQWWQRMWVVQEYVLAKDVDFISGHSVIPGAKLVTFAKAFFDHQADCCTDMDRDSRVVLSTTVARQLLSIIEMEKIREQSGKLDFLELASLYRARGTTDLHDKVYGLLSLAKESDQISIDYGLSTSRSYEEAALGMIRATDTLDMFSHIVDHRPPPGWRPKTKDEPIPPPEVQVASWVPNWSAELYPAASEAVKIRMRKIPYHSASGDKKALVIQHEPGKIKLRGIIMDTIRTVGKAQSDRGDSVYSIREWRALARVETDPDEPYVDGQSTCFDAFWRSLILDVDALRDCRADDETRQVHDAWWWGAMVEEYNRALGFSYTGPDLEKNVYAQASGMGFDLNFFRNDVSRSIAQRRFFISEKGYMGLAPAKAEPGDFICVLYGGRLPYVLRACEIERSPEKVEIASKEFTFIGDSCVHGLMDGEAIGLLRKDEAHEEEIVLR